MVTSSRNYDDPVCHDTNSDQYQMKALTSQEREFHVLIPGRNYATATKDGIYGIAEAFRHYAAALIRAADYEERRAEIEEGHHLFGAAVTAFHAAIPR